MAKVSARGGFHLLWGLAASTVITSIGVIVLARLLSADNFGLYAVALIVPNLISNFRDWGTSYAIVKYSAQYSSENKLLKVKAILFSGLVFQTSLALVLTFITFLFSDYLAVYLFGRPDLGYLIEIVSLSLLSGAFLSLIQTKTGTSTSVAQAAFVGLEKTQFNSVTLLVNSVIRTVVTSLLVLFGFGTFGAVFGFTVSLLLAGLVALLLIWVMYRDFPKMSISEMNILDNLKLLLSYGFPLSVGNIVRNFLLQYYLIVLAIFASDALVGNYSVATNFVVLITFFATPVITMLYPAFSQLDSEKDSEDLKNVFRFSVKYGALMVVPVTFLLISVSQPAVFTLFGSKYDSAPLFLSLLSIPYLYSAFGFLSVTNLLNGQGKTRLTLKLMLLTALIGFPLSYLLISQFGVLGLILATLIAEVPSLIIGFYWVHKNYGVTIDWFSSVKIIFSSGVSAGVTYVVISYVQFGSLINLIAGTFVFAVLFLFGSLLLKIISQDDIDNLRNMTKALGSVNRIFVLVFGLYEKLMHILNLE
jgi:O-antigen/teichoic acid export membrane protein